MEEYKISEITDDNKEIKYHYNISEYYRQLLKAEITKNSNEENYKKILEEKPTLKKGQKLMDCIQKSIIEESNHKQFKKDAKKIYNKVGNLFESLTNSIYNKAVDMGLPLESTTNAIKSSSKHISVHPLIKYTGEAAWYIAKGAGNVIGGCTSAVYNTTPVQFLVKKAEGEYVNCKRRAEKVVEGFSSWDGSKKFTFDDDDEDNKNNNQNQEFYLQDNEIEDYEYLHNHNIDKSYNDNTDNNTNSNNLINLDDNTNIKSNEDNLINNNQQIVESNNDNSNQNGILNENNKTEES